MTNIICSIQDIENFIRQIESDYQATQGLILTEYDAQCLLYSKISSHLARNGHSSLNSADEGIMVSPLHTEMPFLDDNNKLLIRPDIILLEAENVSLTQSDRHKLVSRKRCSFGGSATVIELKFCKSVNGINEKFIDLVKGACDKLIDLRRYISSKDPTATLNALVVVFSRSNKRCDKFSRLMEYYNDPSKARIIYATSNLNPPLRSAS